MFWIIALIISLSCTAVGAYSCEFFMEESDSISEHFAVISGMVFLFGYIATAIFTFGISILVSLVALVIYKKRKKNEKSNSSTR